RGWLWRSELPTWLLIVFHSRWAHRRQQSRLQYAARGWLWRSELPTWLLIVFHSRWAHRRQQSRLQYA
ncbi:hypothetical protein CQA67_33490, partial [Klebsiella pneumoniae]